MSFEAFGAMEAAGWSDGDVARNYTRVFAAVTAQAIGPALDAVGAGPGLDLLDVCCGHGALTAAAVARGARVTGLDFSPAMLAEARQRAEGVTLVQGDAQAPPFADASFDAVTCVLGLPHIPDQAAALAGMRRVLRPGGRLAAADWAAPEQNAAFRIAQAALAAHGDKAALDAAPPAPPMCAFADPATAAERLDAADFREVSVRLLDGSALFSEPGDLYDMLLNATVRFASILRTQPEERRAAIGAAMAESVAAECATAEGYRVPMPVALITAVAG